MSYARLDQVLFNEAAPRPHNSGHYTIDACYTSQFEQHLRCITGKPLGSCDMKLNAAIMLNILGELDGEESMAQCKRICSRALEVRGASVHWYGKDVCRTGRKMGHVTFVGEDLNSVMSSLSLVTSEAVSPRVPLPVAFPLVGIIMGSDSDLKVMKSCAEILEQFHVPYEVTIVSAHRTPQRLLDYANHAEDRGLKVIVAGAGGAAHLPGMVASMTPLPVIGVPVALKHLDGMDSLYSIVQMPRGVPVACVAVDNATNAGLLAVRILGSAIQSLNQKMLDYQQDMKEVVLTKAHRLEQEGWQKYMNV